MSIHLGRFFFFRGRLGLSGPAWNSARVSQIASWTFFRNPIFMV